MDNKVFIYELRDPNTRLPRYVGKTKNCMSKRLFEHINRTKKKIRNNRKLDKKESWIYSLLKKDKKPTIHLIETVNNDTWKEKEIFYISQYREKFDLTNQHDGGMSVNVINKKPVAKIDYLTLEIIETFESIYEAERKEGVPYTRIIDSCSGRKMKVNGFLWNYLDEKKSLIKPKYVYSKRKIGKFNLKKELLKIYNSYEDTGYNAGNISKVCLGKKRSCYSFIWRHLDVYNNILEPKIQYKEKTCSVLDENKELIEVFESANQAAIFYKINPDEVRKYCLNNNIYHNKFWVYNDY